MSESKEHEHTPESQEVAYYVRQMQSYVDFMFEMSPADIITRHTGVPSYDHGPGEETSKSGYARSFVDGRVLKVSRVSVRHEDGQAFRWSEFTDLSLDDATHKTGRHIRSWVLVIPDFGRPKITLALANKGATKRRLKVTEETVYASPVRLSQLYRRLQDSAFLSGENLERFVHLEEESSVEKLESMYKLGRTGLSRFFKS